MENGRPSLRDQNQQVLEAQRRAELEFTQQRAQEGEFKKGLRAGMQNTEAAVHGLRSVGNAMIGDDEASVRAAEEAKRISDNAALLGPEVSDLSQIENLGDVRSYITGALGQALPSIATIAAGGGVGGVVAKAAATKLAERQIAKAAGQFVAKKVAGVTTKQGVGAGAYLTGTGIETGSLQQNILDPANRAAWESVQRGGRLKDAQNGITGYVTDYLDGDTFVFQPDDGSEPYRVRLPNINTADVGQEGKDAAAERLRSFTEGKQLSTLSTGNVDRFGRRLDHMYPAGSAESLSEQMLRAGAASVHPGYPGQDNLYKLEREGRQAPGALPNYLTRHQQGQLTPEQIAARDNRGDIPDPAQSVIGRPLSLREQTMANIAGGAVSGALESLLPLRIFDKFGARGDALKYITADTGVQKALGVAKSVAKEGAKGMPLEGATEGLQQAVQLATNKFIDQNKEVFGDEGISEILNATAAGAVGGLWGGVGGANVHFKTTGDPEMDQIFNELDRDSGATTSPEEFNLDEAPLPGGPAADGIGVQQVGAEQLTPEELAAFGLDQAFSPLDPGFEQIEQDMGYRPDSPLSFDESQTTSEISPYERQFTENVVLTPEANQALGGKPVPAGQEPGIVRKAAEMGTGHKVVSLRQKVEAEAQKQFPADPTAQAEYVRSYAQDLFSSKDPTQLFQAYDANVARLNQLESDMAQAEQVLGPQSDRVAEIAAQIGAVNTGLEGIAKRIEGARDHTALFDAQRPAAFLDHFQTIEGPETTRSEAEFEITEPQAKKIVRSVSRDYQPSGSSVRIGDKAVNLQRLVATVSQQMMPAMEDRGLPRNLGDQLLTGITLLAERGEIQLPVQKDASLPAKRQAAAELVRTLGKDTVIYRKGNSQITVGQALSAKTERNTKDEYDKQNEVEEVKDPNVIDYKAMGPVKRSPTEKRAMGTFIGRDDRFEKRQAPGDEKPGFEEPTTTRAELDRLVAAGRAAAKQIGEARKLVKTDPQASVLETRRALQRFGTSDAQMKAWIAKRPTGTSPAQSLLALADRVMKEQQAEYKQKQAELETSTKQLQQKQKRQELHSVARKVKPDAKPQAQVEAEQAAERKAGRKVSEAKVAEMTAAQKPAAQSPAALDTADKPAVQKVDDSKTAATEKRLHEITSKEDYSSVDTPEKVLAFASQAKKALGRISNIAEDDRTDQQSELHYALGEMFAQRAGYGMDWDMMFDGMKPTDKQRAQLDAIVKAPLAAYHINRTLDQSMAAGAITGERVSIEDMAQAGDPVTLKAENAILKTWRDAFGLKQDVQIVGSEDLPGMLLKLPDNHMRERIENGSQMGFAWTEGNVTHIFVHPGISDKQQRLEVIAHELGHTVMKDQFKKTDAKTQLALRKAHDAWRKSIKGKTVNEIRLSAKAKATAVAANTQFPSGVTPDKLSHAQRQYVLSFNEWFADQTARWLTTNAKPLGVVENFFAKLAALLRKAFGSLQQHGFMPDATVADYLDTLYSDTSVDPVLSLLHVMDKTLKDKVADLLMHPGVGARHAAIRASLYEYLNKEEVQALGNVFSGKAVRNQLRELLLRDGRLAAAKEMMRNPEASIAYGYEYFVSGGLQLGPKGGGLMDKITSTAEQHLGTVRTSKRAEEILTAYRNGLVQARAYGTGDFAIQPAQLREKRLQKGVASAREMAEPIANALSMATFSAVGQMRRTKNPYLRRIADMFAPDVVTRGEREGFHEARRRYQGRFAAKVQDIFAAHADDAEFGVRFSEAMNAGELSKDPEVAAAQQQVWDFMSETRGYLTSAGVKLGTQGVQEDGTVRYWPHIYDREYLADHLDTFVQLIETHAPDAFLTGRVVFDPKSGKKTVEPGVGNITPEARHAAAIRIANSVFDDKGSGDGDLTQGKTAHRPFMTSFDLRSLSFIPDKEIAPFLSKDPGDTLHTYIDQAVKRAEFVRRFGSDGERLNVWLERARQAGATPNQIKLAHKFVSAQMGTLGADKINPNVRKAMGAMMVFQNVRTLSMALLSSLVDPMGILVRSGDLKTSLRAFKAGIESMLLKHDTQMDEIAEVLGTVESSVINEALNWEYGGIFLGGRAARINNALFKYTGLTEWTRATRVMATQAAMDFITKHATKPGKHSERYLDELGLTAADVKAAIDKDGGLNVADNDKLQIAINRWVDEAILRPNSAQRPIWGSDPRFMLVFHLKQFTYSFYDRILRRAWSEMAQYGNIAPAMHLLGYIPVMLAADLLRDALKDPGDDFDDDRKDDWGLLDYTWQATQRAGLLGVGQFAFDAQEAAEMGKPFFLPWAGPTADWGASVVNASMTGNWGEWVAKQYPGQNLINPILESL